MPAARKLIPPMCLILALMALPAGADKLKVWVDYDHGVDFSVFETFAYAPALAGMRSQDELIDKWIVEGLVERLKEGGLRQVETDADIIVTYQITGQEVAKTNILDLGPVWGTGWAWGSSFAAGWGWAGGMWYAPTAMVTDYAVGGFVVEAYDTSSKLGIWRGAAEYSFYADYDQASVNIEKALRKMSEKWQHLHKGK
jgi:hypothetical protein